MPCHQHCLSKWGELEEVLEGKHGSVDFHNRRNRFGYTWDSFSCTVKLFEVFECRMYLTLVTLPAPVSSDFLNICSSSFDLLGLRNTSMAGKAFVTSSGTSPSSFKGFWLVVQFLGVFKNFLKLALLSEDIF